MARKRMLSPEIWESESFSSLSDLGKIVFIGLISLADDEGRGKANPSLVKSTLFPYDEKRRVADIKFALSEIARSMSTQFYSVNGNDYYLLLNWSKWQKIDKPSKSKIPAPPSENSCGVGGLLPESEKNEKFDEYSTNTPRTFDESSSIKKNRIEKNKNTTTNVVAENGLSSAQYSSLCDAIGKADCDYYILRVKAFLKKYPKANFDAYSTILKWHREDVKNGAEIPKVEKTYTSEQLNGMFENLSYEDL